MGNPSLSYLRIAIAAAGLADGLLFNHATGPLTALFVLGIFEAAVIVDARIKLKRKIEDEM